MFQGRISRTRPSDRDDRHQHQQKQNIQSHQQQNRQPHRYRNNRDRGPTTESDITVIGSESAANRTTRPPLTTVRRPRVDDLLLRRRHRHDRNIQRDCSRPHLQRKQQHHRYQTDGHDDGVPRRFSCRWPLAATPLGGRAVHRTGV